MINIHELLVLSIILFTIGLLALIIRKNFLFILIGLEIIMLSISLIFISAGNYWEQTDGQIMFILIISITAAQIAIGLSLLLQLHRRYNTLNIDAINEMKK